MFLGRPAYAHPFLSCSVCILPDAMAALLEPVRKTMKGLRQLSEGTSEDGVALDKADLVRLTKQYLLAIGRHIDSVVSQQGHMVREVTEELSEKLWHGKVAAPALL